MHVFPVLSIPPMYPLNESYEDLTIRTGYEAGYDHTRPRYTSAFRKTYEVKYTHINQYDKQLLDYFVTYIDEGLNTFTWANPTKNNVVNKVNNGSFVVSTDGWTSNNSTLTIISGGVSGNCLHLTDNGYGVIHGVYPSSSLNLSIGTKYRCTAWNKSETTNNNSWLAVWSFTSSFVATELNETSTNYWRQSSIVWTVTTADERPLCYKNGADLGDFLYDEVSVTEATSEVGVRFATLPKYSYIKKGYWDCDFTLVEA